MKATRKRISTVATVSLLFLLSVLTIVPRAVLGDTEYLDPNGDNGTNEWTPSGCTDHHDCVDDAIRQPNTGIDGNYLTVAAKNNDEAFDYGNPVESGTVSDVIVWIYGRVEDGNDYYTVTPSGVSGWSPSAVNTASPGATNSWVSATWSSLSIDMAEFNSLVVTIRAVADGPAGDYWIMETTYTELTYTGVSPASLTVTLRKSDNTQERIDVGYWGNMTVSAGATNQQSSNFVRAQCDDCDGSDDSFWVNWSGTTWDSAKVGDSIDIDSNYRLWYYETASGTACPDDGGWSWTDGGVDADGDFQITFSNSGTTYMWVKYQIEAIPSPLGGADDYAQTYVVTLDR